MELVVTWDTLIVFRPDPLPRHRPLYRSSWAWPLTNNSQLILKLDQARPTHPTELGLAGFSPALDPRQLTRVFVLSAGLPDSIS